MAESYFIFSSISTSLSILRFYFFVCTTFRLSYLEYNICLIADPSELESVTLSDRETDTIISKGSNRNEQGLKEGKISYEKARQKRKEIRRKEKYTERGKRRKRNKWTQGNRLPGWISRDNEQKAESQMEWEGVKIVIH